MIRHMRRQHGAFTLIELLVVITIIGILAAMLFPVFGRIRERGRQAVCMSNLKQLGVAAALYEKDYNYLPGPYEWVKGNWQSPNMANVTNGSLWQYTGNVGLYACPSFRAQCGVPKVLWSYVENAYIGNYDGDPTGTRRCFRSSDVHEQWHLVLFAEENWNTPNIILGRIYPCALNDGAMWTDGRDSLGTFHDGSCMACFLDGHVEKIKWTGTDPQQVNGYYCWPYWPGQK